jgi:acyl dehydratase
MLEIEDLRVLATRLGDEVAVSDWIDITQDRIDTFAIATGDDQWIHTDPERAAVSPSKTTIAHGFLTLSLISLLVRRAIVFPPLRMSINCGLNRVLFVAPVPVASRIRARLTPVAVEEATNSLQITWSVVIERENAGRCVLAEWLVRYYLP